jgi:hypothetical protein
VRKSSIFSSIFVTMTPTFVFMEDKAQSGAIAVRCWIEGRLVWLELSDQRMLSFPAAKYPLLARAAPEDLAKVTLRLHGRALRWESLDEDILVEDAVAGRFPRPSQTIVV